MKLDSVLEAELEFQMNPTTICEVCGREYSLLLPGTCNEDVCPECCVEGKCPYKNDCLYWNLKEKIESMNDEEFEEFKQLFIEILIKGTVSSKSGITWLMLGGHSILADIVKTLTETKDKDYAKKFVCAVLKRICGGAKLNELKEVLGHE